jgi:hypothetical protein
MTRLLLLTCQLDRHLFHIRVANKITDFVLLAHYGGGLLTYELTDLALNFTDLSVGFGASICRLT